MWNKQPEGFEINEEDKVYKPKKALYGLKQAPQAWYNKINAYFQQNQFFRSENEPTLYVKKQGTSGFIIVCLYVDDIIYMGSSKSLLEEFKVNMMSKFEMTDLCLLHYYLGIEIVQDEAEIFVCQKYAADFLKRFIMLDCKMKATPMNINQKMQEDDGAQRAKPILYRSLVGGLIYLTHTRPDISFALRVVSSYASNPSIKHFGAAKRILRYIAGTLHYGIWYTKSDHFKLVGFTNSDWASSLDDRKNTSGNVFGLGTGAIKWLSKKQATIALFTAEAEYVAATAVACQCIWLRRILEDAQQKKVEGTKLYCDNK